MLAEEPLRAWGQGLSLPAVTTDLCLLPSGTGSCPLPWGLLRHLGAGVQLALVTRWHSIPHFLRLVPWPAGEQVPVLGCGAFIPLLV